MAETANPKAPYAPTQTVATVIDRVRKGLTGPITPDTLMRASVPDSLVPRTLQSLQMLNLIDADGKPTATLQGLQRAGEADLPNKMREWLNEAYADVLRFADPATATENTIRDAFRSYDPVGQQPRMVSLFVGLYKMAGVRAQGRAAPTKNGGAAVRPRTTLPKSRIIKPTRDTGAGIPGGMPPALSGLLSSLPTSGTGWTQDRRDSFVSTFGAVLDFCFPIVEAAEESADNQEGDGE